MNAAASIRVLIVDDKSMMRSLLARLLESIGFRQLYFAASPEAALPIARRERVHLIISDYNMSNMNGLEFLSAVRDDAILNKIGFIMVSGSGDYEIAQEARDLGADSYIMKPVSREMLEQRIVSWFARISHRGGPPKARRLEEVLI